MLMGFFFAFISFKKSYFVTEVESKPSIHNRMFKSRLTVYIFVAMLVGILTGVAVRYHFTTDGTVNQEAIAKYTGFITILSDIFLRLIKMIIAPLVFSTLAVGVAKLGDLKAVGRIGGKTMLWFISATIISLSLGMLLVNLLKPGAAMNLTLPDPGIESGVKAAQLNVKDFVTHLVPKSFIEAMSNNEILQIIVFSIFFGISCAAIGDLGKPVIQTLDSLAHIILKMTSLVMNMAPLAVFAAIASIVAQQGIGVLLTFGTLIGEFYFGLLLLWGILLFMGWLVIGKRIGSLVSHIKDPVLLAFSTASSESAFPKLLQQLERFGCNNRIVSFVLPLGYSFNLDGSMMYMTFASLFIAQCYNIHLGFGEQISMLLILMLTSKGIAGVPRASLVVISGALATFHIPETGLLLLMGIDQLLDMGRSATNVVGNAVAATVVSKWEGELTN